MIWEENIYRREPGDCTGFMAAYNSSTFFGINEDIHDFDPEILIYKKNEEKQTNGRIIFKAYHKHMDFHTSGVNEKGLMYDQYDHQFYPVLKNSFKKPYKPFADLESYCIATCSTVEEVKREFSKYRLWPMSIYQSFFVDKSGAWIIIEGNKIYDDISYNEYGVKYQVCSNFLHSHPYFLRKGWRNTKWRYHIAKHFLQDLTTDYFNNKTPGVKDYFKEICDACHSNLTKYSYICELSKNKLYLYFYGDFNEEITIDIPRFIKEKHSTNQEKTNPIKFGIPSYCNDGSYQPPNKPKIYGPKNLIRRIKNEFYGTTPYTVFNQLLYKFDWDDGTKTQWITPVNTQTPTCKKKHAWKEKGNYNLRVKARTKYGDESPWSDPLPISVH